FHVGGHDGGRSYAGDDGLSVSGCGRGDQPDHLDGTDGRVSASRRSNGQTADAKVDGRTSHPNQAGSGRETMRAIQGQGTPCPAVSPTSLSSTMHLQPGQHKVKLRESVLASSIKHTAS